jgi:hypothetical protein
MKIIIRLFQISLFLVSGITQASETMVKNVVVSKGVAQTFNFSVTLVHGDKSWDHYANVWQVETITGEVLAKRILQHPHINEQPFTRSLSAVVIKENIKKVIVVAGCTVDGLNSNKFTVTLPER